MTSVVQQAHALAAPLPRLEVLDAASVVHGALDYAELEALGLQPKDVIDFSVCSNPLGPSPNVLEALRTVPPERYPDRECLALRRALAGHLRVRVEQIVVGNGTSELLSLIATAFLRPPTPDSRDAVVVFAPTFGEYRRAAELAGALVQIWESCVEDGFVPVAEATRKRLQSLRPRIAFLCQPNNPTGTVYPLDAIKAWSAASPHTLFVVDEAYLAFAAGVTSTLVLDAPNVLVLRSMTKDYALAGLRLGYAVGPEPLVSAVASMRPPWNVNAYAQAAGVAALDDDVFLRDTLSALRHEKDRLTRAIAEIGFEVLPSEVHFFLVNVGCGADVRVALLREAILVRDCASFGLPQYVRIAPRRSEENDRLVAALERFAPDSSRVVTETTKA